MVSSEVVINNDNFETEVLNSETLVLVDFWAQWCGPCKMLMPIIDELSKEFEGKVKICKVNVDEVSELADRYKIATIPTLLLFKGGEMVEKIVGIRSIEDLLSVINKHL